MWSKYRDKFGPLTLQKRQEKLAAAQMLQLSCLHGGKKQLEDFMLFTREELQEISLEQALEKWV